MSDEAKASEDHAWERIERARESIASAERDLATAIRRRSLPRLSSVSQTIANHGIELNRLLGRLEERRGDLEARPGGLTASDDEREPEGGPAGDEVG